MHYTKTKLSKPMSQALKMPTMATTETVRNSQATPSNLTGKVIKKHHTVKKTGDTMTNLANHHSPLGRGRSEAAIYIIAMLRNDGHIIPLDVGRRYGREAALLRAEMLQETCEYELKYLDGERFIPYSLVSE